MSSKIIFQNSDGGVSVIHPAPGCGLSIEQIAAKDVPQGAAFQIIDASALPEDRVFRDAWELRSGVVVEDHQKAAQVAHHIRRKKRSAEFAPLDKKMLIPAEAASAESAREKVREKYAKLQNEIDAAPDIDALRDITKSL